MLRACGKHDPGHDVGQQRHPAGDRHEQRPGDANEAPHRRSYPLRQLLARPPDHELRERTGCRFTRSHLRGSGLEARRVAAGTPRRSWGLPASSFDQGPVSGQAAPLVEVVAERDVLAVDRDGDGKGRPARTARASRRSSPPTHRTGRVASSTIDRDRAGVGVDAELTDLSAPGQREVDLAGVGVDREGRDVGIVQVEAPAEAALESTLMPSAASVGSTTSQSWRPSVKPMNPPPSAVTRNESASAVYPGAPHPLRAGRPRSTPCRPASRLGAHRS